MTVRRHLSKLRTVKGGRASIEGATREPMGCLSSLGSQRKGGFGDRFRGSAWDKLPAVYCPLEFRRPVPVKKEGGG